MNSTLSKVVITGAAGLVGQNLIPRLKESGVTEIVALDKHSANLRILRKLHPDITVLECDLAQSGPWEQAVLSSEYVVVAHAQIGGIDETLFARNNITATERLLAALSHSTIRHVVHISSSVVNSAVVDWYTESKKAQESIVVRSGFPHTVLRPTLMFGWFDRKHLGWLARFMKRVPVFPVPGSGRFLRQPLYAGDFCNIVAQCLRQAPRNAGYNISGLEKIEYIDLVRDLRVSIRARAAIVNLPYSVFWALLRAYSVIDKNPPFTTKQLEALVTPEVFEVIDWPSIFGVQPTPLREALHETFQHPNYSSIELEF